MTETAEKGINEQHFSELLNQVNSLLKIKRNIPRVPGKEFNVFSVLNMESDEEKTHNRLIYEFLNKNGSHGMGDVFLREFFNMVLGKDYPEGKVNVEREYSFDDGRIDILIYGDNFRYPIEMKIYAGDQYKQIERYNKYAEQKTNHKVYYLTLDGHEPSEDSLGKKLSEEMKASKQENIEDIKETHVECISFDHHIRKWLERCSEIAWKAPSITGIIQQYIKLIDKLTGHFEEDIIMEGIKDTIGSSKKYYESALAIEQSLPQMRTEKMKEFFEKIQEHMDSKLDFLCSDYGEKAENYYNTKPNYPSLSYRIKSLDGGITIALRFEVAWRFGYGVNFYNEKNEQLKCCDVNSIDVKDAFGCEKWETEVVAQCKPKGKNSPWLWWRYLPSGHEKENETSDDKDINFKTCNGLYKNLFDSNEQESLMKKIFDMIDDHLDSILETGLP